jgi:hypothetical protein
MTDDTLSGGTTFRVFVKSFSEKTTEGCEA